MTHPNPHQSPRDTSHQNLNITLQQADAMTLLATLPSDSVDLIATDPPYYRVKSNSWDNQWPSEQHYLDWLNQVLAELARVMTPLGSIYLFAGPHMATRVENLMGNHFNILNHLHWRKQSGRHQGCRVTDLRRFFPQTESIIFADSGHEQSRGDISHHFEPLRAYLDQATTAAGITRKQIDQATGTQMSGHWLGRSQWAIPSENHYQTINRLTGGKMISYTDLQQRYQKLRQTLPPADIQRRVFNAQKPRPHTNIWDFSPVRHYPGKHPCEKPLDLIEHILLTSSNPGQTVLDPFAGSGTTAIACINHGRQFIGSEIGQAEHQQAMTRINKALDGA